MAVIVFYRKITLSPCCYEVSGETDVSLTVPAYQGETLDVVDTLETGKATTTYRIERAGGGGQEGDRLDPSEQQLVPV